MLVTLVGHHPHDHYGLAVVLPRKVLAPSAVKHAFRHRFGYPTRIRIVPAAAQINVGIGGYAGHVLSASGYDANNHHQQEYGLKTVFHNTYNLFAIFLHKIYTEYEILGNAHKEDEEYLPK